MKVFGNFIRSKAFEIVFLLFSCLSVFYVSDRIEKFIFAFFNINTEYIIFVILSVIMGYMYFYTKSNKKIKKSRKLHEVLSVIICIVLYLVIGLWIYDILDLFFHFQDDRGYILPIVFCILVTFYGFLHAKKLYIKKYKIKLKDKSEAYRLILLSDIHTGSYVDFKQLSKIVDKVNELNTDIVLIAGDMFDVEAFQYCDKNKISEILRKLKANSEKYSVLGNHDPDSHSGEIKDFYKASNIRLLIDEVIETDKFVIVGRDDITTNPKRRNLKDLLSQILVKKPVIVMDHNPLGINDAVFNSVDLILCGHTHKGQFFPANIFTKLAYGKVGYYGYHKIDKTNIVISSGAGFFQMPMRIGSNSEIVVIDII